MNLHRSITFWSGLLAVFFILWAWGDSTDHLSSAHYRGAHAVHAASGLTLGYNPDPSTEFISQRLDRGYEVMTSRGRYAGWSEQKRMAISRWPKPLLARKGAGVFLPYWLILLGTLGLWAGLLYWRLRRTKRKGEELRDPS